MQGYTQTRSGLKRNLFILKTLVMKDFKLKYRRSVLGIVWSVLNPFLMMVVLSVVFSQFFRFAIDNYPLYLILGTILFNMMANSTTAAMNSIIDSAPLIKKIRIEKILFPLEKVFFELLNFAFSLIAVIIVMLFFQVAPTTYILLLPILLVCMVLFCSGLGMALAALTVFFRDVAHLWSVVITAWTYLTPIFYPLDILPDMMKGIMEFNPMFHYVTYFRDIVMSGINPGIMETLICIIIAIVTFAIGLLIFRKTEHKFILYV